MEFSVPYGDDTLAVSTTSPVRVLEPPTTTPVDVTSAARAAIDRPQGPPLEERVSPGDSVAVVVTDMTRASADEQLLEALLDALEGCGVDREAITIVVGLGLHRPMTETELEEMLGEHADLASNHDPSDVEIVGAIDGCPIEIGTPVVEADVICSTGVVEPHQYAGFSGGAKTVVIGAGGEPLIRHTHGPDMLAREGVRLGRLEGNPFRETLDRAGDLVGIDFCVNLAQGPHGVLGVVSGDHRAVVESLATRCMDALAVSFDPEETYDTIVCGLGAPKDANLYQATRAATYVALGDHVPLRPGGRLVVPAALPEGAGGGIGEKRFFDRLSTAQDPDSLYERLREGYEPGAQRAFVLARVLREYEVYVTNSECPEIVEACLLEHEPAVKDALEGDTLVVQNAIQTVLRRDH